MNNLGIVINREYRERVAKKSFIVTTLLMPLLMLALCVAPGLIMALGEQSEADVLVIDNSGRIAQNLTSDEETRFILTDITVDSAMRRDDVNAVLVIPAQIIDKKNATIDLYNNGASSMSLESKITGQINKTVEDIRLKSYNIENLDKILDEVKSDVKLQTTRYDREEQESTSTELSFGLGIMLTFVLYMFLLIYGQMVLTSIVEEKSNRVLELVVSSVKPAQMMLGKILGVALVAVTQIVIWAIVMSALVAFVVPAVLPAEMMSDITAVNAGNLNAVSDPDSIGVIKAAAALTNIGYMMNIMVTLALFLIGGFLFYAAIYAAIGSAVDNIQDASQLTSVVVMPVILGLILAMQAANAPESSLAFWMSMIPLTSPMVMMARIPFGIPGWEVALSLVILAVSTLAVIWAAGKIYRVGIFMYGKKPTVKELIRWVKYK